MKHTPRTLLALLLSLSSFAATTRAQQTRRPTAPAPAAQPAAQPTAEDAPPSADDPPPKSGYVPVRVNKNDYNNITERIGLAPNCVTFIEFPFDDPLYAVHEGNENFAKVDKGDDKRGEPKPTDALVIRPGKGFKIPAKGEPTPSTIVTVQRASGVVVTFEVVPVARASENANRVVVTYDISAVLEARRRAGLATNLVPASELQQLGIQTVPGAQQPPAVRPDDAPAALPVADEAAAATDGGGPSSAQKFREEQVLTELTVAALRRVGNSKPQLKFGKPSHGLAMAVAPNTSRTSDVVIEVVAVRNVLSMPIRLVPDQPDLFIESRAEKGGAATLGGRVPVLHVATTIGDDDVLQPGVTYYVAFAYNAPMLGAKQTLRVVMAQMNASDEPASADLVASAR